MSVFKGRKFETSVTSAYFDIFQLKPVVKSDNIHNLTEISIFSSIQGGNLLKQISNWWEFLTFLISHTISYCFSTRHAYLTPVPSSEQIIVIFKSLGAICMPKCYTHAPIISGICHFKWW